MTTHCRGCGKELDETARYCACGGHFHADCYEGHRDFCPVGGPDRWIGAVEL